MGAVAVLGSGIIGSAAAWDMARRGHDVVVADRLEAAVDLTTGSIGHHGVVVDAADETAVRDLLADVDLVVSGLPYALGESVARVAVATATHYFDFGGNPTIVRRQLDLDAAAIETEVVIVPDCGLAPGMANVLATGVIDALGEGPIDELRLRVGALPATRLGSLGYQLVFNPVGLINEYDEPCEVLRGGVPTQVEPLTGIEEVAWEPFGPLEAFHTAGGSSSLPARFAGRVAELDYKTLRYPGHAAAFRAMRELGMFSEVEQPHSGVAPRAVLLEALTANLPRDEDDLVLMRMWARRGTTTIGHEMVDRNDDRFSALTRTTAFPTTALADLVLAGSVEPGARTMSDAMAATDLIEGLEPAGIHIGGYSPDD